MVATTAAMEPPRRDMAASRYTSETQDLKFPLHKSHGFLLTDADDHDAFVGRCARPQLPSQLAVDLEGNLLDDRGQALLVADRLVEDDLEEDNEINNKITKVNSNNR